MLMESVDCIAFMSNVVKLFADHRGVASVTTDLSRFQRTKKHLGLSERDF